MYNEIKKKRLILIRDYYELFVQLQIISVMCIVEIEGYAVGRPVDDRGLPPDSAAASALLDTKIVKVGDSSLLPLSSPNDAMEIRLLSSPLPTTAEKKKGKGRRHRRHNRRNHKSQTGLQRWKMIAGMSSFALSQLDYEIYLLAKTLENNGIPIPTSSLLHPSPSSLQPSDVTSAEEFNNLDCCPSYQFTYKSAVAPDINGLTVFLAGHGEDYNSSAIQTFNGVNCFPHVVNKPCRFLFQLHPDAVCAQKYSYTRALLKNAKGDQSAPDNSGATADIRVPSGCQCEIPI